MKTKKTSFLARAAMMLLVMVLTTTAWADPVSVSYIDANGNTQNADATVIDGTQTTLPGGFYVVNNNVNLTTKLNFTGDAYLILADGKTLSITASSENGYYYGLLCRSGSASSYTYHDLTIYGQTQGTGKVSISSASNCYGYFAENITINGGIVEAKGSYKGVAARDKLTINGGQVISANAEIRGNNVTLGWRNSTDYIQANEIGCGSGEGCSIQIASGKVFTDGTSLYTNTTTKETLDKLHNVTLRPCLVLSANADNAEAIASYSGKTIAVALNGCTLKMDGKWNSLCLPFDVTIADSPLALPGNNPVIKVFSTSSSLTDGTLTLKFFDAPATIPAGTPFIIKWAASTKTIENPVFVGVTISNTAAQEVTSTDGKVKFVGQYSPFGITNENINEIIYLGDNDAIGYASTAMTLPSFGTHFVVPTTGEKAATSIAMSIVDWSGSGSEDDPYIISNTDQLDVLAQRVNAGVDGVVNGFSGKFFKLGDNIAYNKETANNFTPIGDGSGCYFYGTFDGDGKTISGININSGSATQRGIFGIVSGTMKNLVVSNCSIVGLQFIGAIAGKLVNNGTIENCHVGKDVTLSSGNAYSANVGGIVGSCDGGTIKGCTCAATITGTNNRNVGGIVGGTYEYGSTSPKLTDNIFTGTITGNLTEYIGAIVGQNNSGTLTNNLTSTGFGGIGKPSSTTGADDAGARKALTISAATGVTITPTGTATTYKTSGITSYADNKVIGYDSKFYAGATDEVTLTVAYTAPSGYAFNKIDAGEGVTVTASDNAYTITMPTSNVTVDVVYNVIEYTLQYNGADGATFATANPTTYTVESDAITLTNPTKDGYTFAGWTGTDITDATTTVTIAKGSTGNREYTATWKKLLTNTDIKVSAIANQTYTGSALTPAVTVKDGTTDITSQCDIAYSNNTNVGTATVTITAKATSAAYSGETTTTFGINAADGSLTVPTAKTGLVYSGSKQDLITAGSSTTGTIQYSLDGTNYGTTVPQGQDAKEYTVYYKVVAKDGYKDVEPASLKVTIAPKTVSSPTITLSATEYEYDGTAKEPSVTSVKDGDTVIPASEYTVSYENNKEAGTATVQIVDKEGGNYAVSGSTTFTIKAKADPDTDPDTDPSYEVDANGVATTTTIEDLAELALDDTMQDYVEKGKLKATVTPKNKYWTLACGVDLLLPEGVKVYKARMNSAGTKVELTEIDATTLGGVLKANNGVLIASTPGQTYDLVVSPNNSVTTLSNADAKSYGTDNELEPVLEDTHFTTEDYFILTENKFIMVDISKDTKVPAGKAVLKVAAGSAKTRTLDVIDGETTGISSAVNSADDEVWYNLQGQRISKPTRKGVYILNGKKVRR